MNPNVTENMNRVLQLLIPIPFKVYLFVDAYVSVFLSELH
jgi:hypothetical protein